MALVPVDKLMYGIRQIESGGQKDPYRVVNSIGAHGAYQVMRANIPSWTREALGRTLTPAQFLASNKAQDDVARHYLAKHMKKYGSWEAAAAVWFSGQPNPNSSSSDGGNTVRQYVDKVARAMAGYRGAGPDTPGGATPVVFNPLGPAVNSLTGAMSGIAGSLVDMAKSVTIFGDLATFLIKLALPTTWVRIMCGILGGAFLLLGLLVLGKEARDTK